MSQNDIQHQEKQIDDEQNEDIDPNQDYIFECEAENKNGEVKICNDLTCTTSCFKESFYF